MTPAPTAPPTVGDHLRTPLRCGEPDVAGPLAVYPLFGPAPRLEYRSLAAGAALGLTISELGKGASVNDLVVVNPTDAPVLLYEGEEVLGARQNRVFDVSVLVAAGAALDVPVSCVEQGRWESARHDEPFHPAPQAAYPGLRRLKNRQASARLAAGLGARADQAAVWVDVGEKSARLGVRSRTGALHDAYEDRRSQLRGFAAAIPLHDAQIGALAAIGGRIAVLDCVSRADVFAALHGPLLQGYALDALEAPADADPPEPDAEAFLGALLAAPVSRRDGIGLGCDLRFTRAGVAGAGLVAGDELVQLTAFAGGDRAGPRRSRVARPSRRRRV